MINYEKFIYYFIFIFLSIFLSSVVITNGYPHNNDILHILKISSLEGNSKFINGSFLPGYTYYTLIFSKSLTILTSVICVLYLVSSYMLLKLIKTISKHMQYYARLCTLTFATLIHCIIVITVGLNHSDAIFIMLFYNGLIFFIYSYYYNRNILYYIIGLSLISISLLFRHHGLIAFFFLYLNFILFEIYYLKKKFIDNYKNFLKIGIIVFIPFILSQIHLFTISAVAEWQTSLKLNYFIYGHTWGDWRDIKFILNSERSKNFDIMAVDTKLLLNTIFDHVKNAFTIVYPFIFCFIISFIICREKIVIISLILFLLFVVSISPGYGRGYYPALFFCFMPIIIGFKKISKLNFKSVLTFILIVGHLFYISERYLEKFSDKYHTNKDISEKVVPILKNKNIKYQNIFSDDYDFYTNQLDGDMNKICNWGGWILAHPYYEKYYPHEVIIGKKNDYCDVKALITKDSVFAEKYLVDSIYKNIYKTNKFYILTTN